MHQERPPGLFISFEGGDGAGKSTQLTRLARALTAAGRTVVTTREPGGTELGVTLRDLLLHGQDIDPRTEALLFAADRAHHVATVIRPALARGDVVLTDRYLDSSIAYQAGGRGLPAAEIAALSGWATAGLLPDLTFLLDVDPRQARARLGANPDRLERASADFHGRLRQAFLDLAAREPERFHVIDATAPIGQIATQIHAEVDAWGKR